MQKLLPLLALALLLSSCGGPDVDHASTAMHNTGLYRVLPDTRHRGIAAEFIPIVQEFERLGGQKVIDIPINFGHVSRGAAAQCEYLLDGRRQIVVRESTWEEIGRSPWYGLDYQEMILFHELGHCVLGKQHKKGRGIMNPGGVMEGYTENRDYYLRDFFGK